MSRTYQQEIEALNRKVVANDKLTLALSKFAMWQMLMNALLVGVILFK